MQTGGSIDYAESGSPPIELNGACDWSVNEESPLLSRTIIQKNHAGERPTWIEAAKCPQSQSVTVQATGHECNSHDRRDIEFDRFDRLRNIERPKGIARYRILNASGSAEQRSTL
jgi:hypothetical protein